MKFWIILIFFLKGTLGLCQLTANAKIYTSADTVRGAITPERAWWDVQRYDITIQPDYISKTTTGSNKITYKVLNDVHARVMQVDLQEPLHIDSVNDAAGKNVSFKKAGSAWYIAVQSGKKNTLNSIEIYFSGKPQEALRPPWQGGWTFAKDSLNRPWMSVTCEGIGASVWYPCKDQWSDEPDKGASLSIIVPDTLVGVANGRLQFKKNNGNGTTTYKWAVTNPINNYNIIPYIGKYLNLSGKYAGEAGKLDLEYWVMDYNKPLATSYMPRNVDSMLKSLEYWFGPYPFYADGYKLVEAPYLGMEHQSAIAYGNGYQPGYRGRDRSGTGWGLKWDYIIVHESGHEWFGNNITGRNRADMWVHESFTTYSETLFIDYMFGKNAADEYNYGLRKGIGNKTPIIPAYDINAQGSGDMYNKGAAMLHTIRRSINNDVLFRQILRGLNKTFYHKTPTSAEIQHFISTMAGFDYSKVFTQYLNTIQIPEMEFYLTQNNTRVYYRYTNCVDGFNLPLVLKSETASMEILPTKKWNSSTVTPQQALLFNADSIVRKYYITSKMVSQQTQ